MSYRIITIFAVRGDGGERGIGPIIDYTRTESEARKRAQGQGWYGGAGDVSPRKAIELDNGDVFALEHHERLDLDGSIKRAKEKARADALAKLTPSERTLLGLDK